MVSNFGAMPKNSILIKYKLFKTKILRSITNIPFYISNFTLHSDLKIKTIHEEAKTYYKRFSNNLIFHPSPLLFDLATHTTPGNIIIIYFNQLYY